MILFNDFNTSVRKALDEIDPDWESYKGLIICGTHTPRPRDVEIEITQIEQARKDKIPVLGICFGLQMMAVEYARNDLGIKDATSEEVSDTGTFVVVKLSELNVGLKDGESYWNNYKVKEDILEKMAKNLFSPRFVGVQYHPEYQSSKDNPHPVLVNFINECQR